MNPESNTSVRAAIYARVSTTDQNCEMQLADGRKEIKYREWPKAAEYVDTGWSGAKASRPALDRLIADVKAGQLDVIWVWKLDRFSRSILQLLQQLEFLKQHKVRFISFKDSIDTDSDSPYSRMMIHILAALAELERAVIAERSLAGRMRKINANQPDSWNLPMGFVVRDGFPDIDQKRMKLALQILQLRHRRKSLYEISDLLHAAGEKPERGRRSAKSERTDRWHATTLSKVCRSSAYIGEYKRGGKTFPILDRNGKLLAPLDRQTFDEIQAEMNSAYQRRVGRPVKLPFLLHRLIFCDRDNSGTRCNTRYTCNTTQYEGKPYRYYRCGNARKREKYAAPPCTASRPIRADLLEGSVWSETWNYLSDPDRFRELAICYHRQELQKQKASLERDPHREMEQLRADEERVQEMTRRKIYSFERADSELKALRHKMGLLQMELAALPKVVEIAPRDVIAENLRLLTEGPEPDDYEGRRRILQTLLDFQVRITKLEAAAVEFDITGRLPISVQAQAQPGGKTKKNCQHRFSGIHEFHEPIPFRITKVRLAA